MSKIYDCIIIGGGPAGLSAGIYAARTKMNMLLVEKLMPGGQVLLTCDVENYPGFGKGTTGPDIAERMVNQAKEMGLEISSDEIMNIKPAQGGSHKFELKDASGKEYKTLSVIIATGAHWKKLGIPGEKKLIGKGVSYCATCDGPLMKGKDIVVVGGGDKAVEEALYLTRFADKVMLIHRRGRLRAVKELQNRLLADPKIKVVWDSGLAEITGDKKVEGISVKNNKTGKTQKISCGAVFIFIGIDPNTAFLKNVIDLDEKGFIIVDNNAKTTREGIFASGDAVKKGLYQIATAVGEGATAAFSAQKYVEELKGTAYK